MKIQLNRLAKYSKNEKNLLELKKVGKENPKFSKMEVLNDIDAVKLDFENKAEKLTPNEYLAARSYLANAELEQLYKVYAKEL